MTGEVISMAAHKRSPRSLRWYAVRCFFGEEIKASVAIARLGVHVFLPQHYSEKKEGKWLISVQDGLLFPPYLFITMRKDGPWGAVKAADGVNHVMSGRNKKGEIVPIPIPYKEMRQIRTLHRASERRRAADRFNRGQKVKITAGAFSGFEATFDEPAEERVKIFISLFGRDHKIEIAEENIRAA